MRRAFPCGGIVCGILLALTVLPSAHAQRRYRPVKDPASPPEIPYTRYFTRDRFDRKITFYIHGDQSQPLPMVVSVLGSGAYSNFIRVGEEIRDGHRAAREAFDGKAHVLIVEKPGIEFLEQHTNAGTSVDASAEFLRENALERWAEAVSAALQAARTLPLADKTRCLLIGHSEGATVVAMVAAQNKFVTHLTSLSGNGPTVLFELMHKAGEGRLYPALPSDPEQQMAQLLADVAAIRADPTNSTRLILGHTPLYWSSRWTFSTMQELSRTKARIFLAHGTADQNVTIAHFDMMYAHLLAQGKDVTARRYQGADHGYRFADQPDRDGWKEVFEESRTWFLESPPKAR
ncbi:MAG: prolyl oligopeptidase family serine peptidase [Acidobacteria bacterium]|nr:prolyl oligopeptidase family serine peptidase [Acidobacteriota bacterium]